MILRFPIPPGKTFFRWTWTSIWSSGKLPPAAARHRSRTAFPRILILFLGGFVWDAPIFPLFFRPDFTLSTALLLLSLYYFNSTPEPRMYLDHEGNCKGDISPSSWLTWTRMLDQKKRGKFARKSRNSWSVSGVGSIDPFKGGPEPSNFEDLCLVNVSVKYFSKICFGTIKI